MSEQKPSVERRRSQPTTPTGADRVSHLLFQWETRDFSPLHRALSAWWTRNRRASIGATLGMMLFVLGAAAMNPGSLTSLQARLLHTQSALRAREGELELARLELNRLNTIIEQSRKHDINADLAAAIYDIAQSEGVDPGLAYSLVRVESGFTRKAISPAGAVGLTQLMPETAFWLQPGLSYKDLFERDTNLRVGFRYLKLMLQQYNGDLGLALLAYNRGPGTVDDILKAGGNPSNGYEKAVGNSR